MPAALVAEALRRTPPSGGEQLRAMLAARARWFELMGLLGGRWPHTHSLQPGGSSRAIEAAERLRLLARVREFRAWLERSCRRAAGAVHGPARRSGAAGLGRPAARRATCAVPGHRRRLPAWPRWAAARAAA
jgi:hypothetical protein